MCKFIIKESLKDTIHKHKTMNNYSLHLNNVGGWRPQHSKNSTHNFWLPKNLSTVFSTYSWESTEAEGRLHW